MVEVAELDVKSQALASTRLVPEARLWPDEMKFSSCFRLILGGTQPCTSLENTCNVGATPFEEQKGCVRAVLSRYWPPLSYF